MINIRSIRNLKDNDGMTLKKVSALPTKRVIKSQQRASKPPTRAKP